MTSRPKPSPQSHDSQERSGSSAIKHFRRHDDPTRNRSKASNGHDSEKREGDLENGNGEKPMYNHNGHKVHKWVQPDGESGRRGINPLKMAVICAKSTSKVSAVTNVLWPFTIAAMILHFAYPEKELWVFITAYIGMVPAANLIGFAGQELARKLPSVIGVILETTLGSLVEIVLFMVLITENNERGPEIIRAAILGSILANLLLCLGLCFFVGGIFHPEQTFHEAISEVGSNLMLVAGMGLIIPAIYYNSLNNGEYANVPGVDLQLRTLAISRATAIILLMAFCVYLYFQTRSHHGLYEDILKADEHRDADREEDLAKDKLTLVESILVVAVGVTFVSFMAIFLVQQIEYMVENHGISDAFMGLILIPLVEKAAEHLTAIDEAYDNQCNAALAHVLFASIQTALLNTPLVVLVGWGLSNAHPELPPKMMTLNFELFDAVVLILAIIVVGSFLRDEKSDYLEGALCFFVYVLIAIAAFYYPNPLRGQETSSGSSESGGGAAAEATATAARMMMGKF